MGVLESANIFGVQIRESANDGSDFSNAASDYRILFVGEDGLFHLKDSAGTVTSPTGIAYPLLAVAVCVTAASYTTTSATPADTNASLAVTFTAPASGNVLVRINATVRMDNTNNNAFLGLREGSTDLGATKYFALQGQTAMNNEVALSIPVYLTGVSAGSHTYKLSYCVNGGGSFIVRSFTNTPVILEVFSAP